MALWATSVQNLISRVGFPKLSVQNHSLSRLSQEATTSKLTSFAEAQDVADANDDHGLVLIAVIVPLFSSFIRNI